MTATTLDEAAVWPLAAVPLIHLPVVLTALEPVTHGAGTSGNTQLLRTMDITLPDGRRTAVPYVSGDSVRHTLRDALAWHLCRTLGLPEGSLPKAVDDLLWSGGSLSEPGNQADLAAARRVHQVLPGLGMMGYSARSDIVASTLYARNVHLVCAENQFRLPAALQRHPHAALPCGALRTEEFGTRHDIASTPAARYIALLEQQEITTTQMIFDRQAIRAGAVLWTAFTLVSATAGHRASLAVALDCSAPEQDGCRVLRLGGRRAQGNGVCRLDADLTVLGDIMALREEYEDRLRANADVIVPLLREVTGT